MLIHLLASASNRYRRLLSQVWEHEARLRGVEFRGPVTFLGRPVLTMAPESRIIMHGKNEFFSSTRCNMIGNAKPCVIRTLGRGAVIEFGKNVGLSAATVCAASTITIGEGTICGSGALIIDNDFHHPTGDFLWMDVEPGNARPVRIGRGCFIGTGAMVLKGVTIGDRAVVGAGAVVTRDVPSGMVAVGNPARNVKGRILRDPEFAASTPEPVAR